MALSLLLELETTAIRDTSHGFRANEKGAGNGTLPDSYRVRVAEIAGESSPTRHYQFPPMPSIVIWEAQRFVDSICSR